MPGPFDNFLSRVVSDCVNGPDDDVPASILPPPCDTCDGAGTVTEGYRDEYGSVVEQSTEVCPDCLGSGDQTGSRS